MTRAALIPFTLIVTCVVAGETDRLGAPPALVSVLELGDSTDTALFESVLRVLLRDSSHGELRVDPRPLRNDARLVTLHGIDMIPDRVEPGLSRLVPGEASDSVARTRRDVMRRLGIAD